MDLTSKPSYEELQDIYHKYFSIPYLGNDLSNKFALISLVCYITYKLKIKKPDTTHWSVLYKINKQGVESVDEDFLKGLSIVCEDFAQNCDTFPTFGIKDKDIPAKIKELLNLYLPF